MIDYLIKIPLFRFENIIFKLTLFVIVIYDLQKGKITFSIFQHKFNSDLSFEFVLWITCILLNLLNILFR